MQEYLKYHIKLDVPVATVNYFNRMAELYTGGEVDFEMFLTEAICKVLKRKLNTDKIDMKIEGCIEINK